MKTTFVKQSIIAAAVALSAGTALAQPFDFQRQFNSDEYVWDHGSRHIDFAPVTPSGLVTSHQRLFQEANVDGIALNDFAGQTVPSGPTRISLYEVYRDSPEGIAYRDYHERFPADTDWAAVARAYRADHGLALAGANGSGNGES